MDYVSTSIDHQYENKPPLRVALEKYRKQKMSEVTWRKVRDLWDYRTQSDWVVSGTSMYDDYLRSDPRGNNTIKRISDDMDSKREYYEIH